MDLEPKNLTHAVRVDRDDTTLRVRIMLVRYGVGFGVQLAKSTPALFGSTGVDGRCENQDLHFARFAEDFLDEGLDIVRVIVEVLDGVRLLIARLLRAFLLRVTLPSMVDFSLLLRRRLGLCTTVSYQINSQKLVDELTMMVARLFVA